MKIKSRTGWEGYVARMGEMRHAYKIIAWKPEGKSRLWEIRCGWEDNIKMYI
jgi:hypothetical protein